MLEHIKRVVNFCLPQDLETFFMGWGSICFSKRTLFHGISYWIWL